MTSHQPSTTNADFATSDIATSEADTSDFATSDIATSEADTSDIATSEADASEPGVERVHRRGSRHRPVHEHHRLPTFPEARLRVTAWPDPVLDTLGHDPRSAYVEQFWLSVLGPSAVLLLRRLAAALDSEPDGFDLHPLPWAQELGLGTKGGRHGPFWRTLDRSCRFGATHRNGEHLAVRRRLAPLSARQIERLPTHLRTAHEGWTAEQLARPRRRTVARWSHGEPPPGAPTGTATPG